MEPMVPILVIICVATLFGGGLLFLTSLVGPKRDTRDPVKLMPYECGLPGQETKATRVSVKYYLTAILFILFDIEIIFLFPWALIFKDFMPDNAVFIFVEMMVFMAILIFGLFYAWKSRALEWE